MSDSERIAILEREVQELRDVLRCVVTEHNGKPNTLAMLGHNIGKNGEALIETLPRFNRQLEYNYFDGRETWIEDILDYRHPQAGARRFAMFKALKNEPDSYASWTYNIAGDGMTGRAIGRFAISGPSNVDNAGDPFFWVNGRKETHFSGGLYWSADEQATPFAVGRMDEEGTYHIGDSTRPIIIHNAHLRR